MIGFKSYGHMISSSISSGRSCKNCLTNEPDEGGLCRPCIQDECEHSDLEGTECLDCGADRTEDMAAAAYDRAKDRD